MDPRCRARMLDHQSQLAAGGDPPKPNDQARSLALPKPLSKNQNSACSRQARGAWQRFERIDDQPLSWSSLAAGHGASYSPRMGSAELRRQQILDAIARAAELARRKPADVQLIAVSKTRPTEQIEPLIEAGQRDFGESRVQEALAKWPPLLVRFPDLRLHGIGRLQSNKAADAVQLFHTIHSLDRRSLLDALSTAAVKADRFPAVYVQVNIGEEEQKGGCPIADIGALVAAVRESPLPLAGLMAIPPVGTEPSPYFALLAKLAQRHDVTGLSIGMSSDFREAVMLGATCVRIGTALFEE